MQEAKYTPARLCHDVVTSRMAAQDLMALERIPDLIKAGVSCFKIEGRLKGPEYVAVTPAAYRWAVDSAWADLASEPDVSASIPLSIPEEQRSSLHQVSSVYMTHWPLSSCWISSKNCMQGLLTAKPLEMARSHTARSRTV